MTKPSLGLCYPYSGTIILNRPRLLGHSPEAAELILAHETYHLLYEWPLDPPAPYYDETAYDRAGQECNAWEFAARRWTRIYFPDLSPHLDRLTDFMEQSGFDEVLIRLILAVIKDETRLLAPNPWTPRPGVLRPEERENERSTD